MTWKSIDGSALATLAQKLVQTPSLSGQESQVAAAVAEELRLAGFDEVVVDRLGNVIGRLGPGRGRKLLYDAHMDTVDVGDLAQWKHSPFGGEIEQGVLHGRGAVDMKGALAAMIHAGKALVAEGVRLAGDLYVVAVVQEEPCEGVAIRHVIEQEHLRPDGVLLGEPTNLQLTRGQRGRIELRVTVHGRSSHASMPERGVNAIYEATRAIVGLQLLMPQFNQDSFLGRGSIAVTEIRSGASSRNAVPDHCTLYVDRRLTTGDTEAKVQAELRRVLTREGVEATVEVSEYHGLSYTGHAMQVRQYFPSWVTSEGEPLLRTAADVVEDMLGFVPRVGKWDFSTDGVYTAGQAGFPTIGFGPGEERYAHTAEEQIKLKDLEAAARVYAELAVRMLGTR